MIVSRSLAAFIVMTAFHIACFQNNAFAQSVPTAEQMHLINQLPPAQRQQALDAIRQLQSRTPTEPRDFNSNESLTIPVTRQNTSEKNVQDLLPELIARPRSSLVVTLEYSEDHTEAEKAEIEQDAALSRLIGSHFFELDDRGVLVLPGVVDVSLLGLEDEGIARRLTAEAELSGFEISVVLLAVEPTGFDGLKPFGYDLFDQNEVGFDPPMAGPVPPDYILGPGDSLRVQLFGNVNNVYEVNVSRDGIVSLPELGPMNVTGITFSEFRGDLKNRVTESLIGTQVSATIGQVRTIRVFVLGDAKRPGSYVVSSLATISSALYRSGGLSEIGSMRSIELKRQGTLVSRLDLYDLLLRGDTSGDRRLQSGDVIFVPPIGIIMSVDGAVKRPAIYELDRGATVQEAVQLAGGFQAAASPVSATLERIDPRRGRIVLSLNLGLSVDRKTVVSTGDALFVPSVLPEVSDAIEVHGHVQRSGMRQHRTGMRLVDVFTSSHDLLPGADTGYVLIRRENLSDRSVSAISADVGDAWQNPTGQSNVRIRPRDRVYVFNLALGRQRSIEPILEEIRLQARKGVPVQEVEVSGLVRAPGAYPLEPGMRVSDLLRAGAGLAEGAYAIEAELTRQQVIDGTFVEKKIMQVNISSALNGDLLADIELTAHDHLSINVIPEWDDNWSVILEGEVKFPGEYQILQGETLSQLLSRAGGLSKHAFPEGAIFLRDSLKKREQDQNELLAARMEADLTSLSLESLDTTGAETLKTGEALLKQLRNTEAVGRLVIDVETIAHADQKDMSKFDVNLRDGDVLMVPTASQEVTVIGEAQQPTSHLYNSGLSRNDYIDLSGGLTRRADKKLIYIVRASGAVVASRRSKWFGRGHKQEIRPGDTIVIPLETDRIRPLTFWTNVAQIVYQGAIAVAAVRTFDN